MFIRIQKLLAAKFKYDYKDEVIPQLEIELLIAKAIKKDRIFVMSEPEFELKDKDLITFNKIFKRRKSGEPMAYILGEKEFYGLKFEVNQNVLIPRPETEELIDIAVNEIKKLEKDNIRILEIGTGSGVIPISILWAVQQQNLKTSITIDAIDISQNAIEVAKNNLEKYQLSNKDNHINFLKADIFDDKIDSILPNSKYDLIISNPPYVPSKEITSLETDVKNFEPINALDGGEDGMNFYKSIINNTKNLTSDNSIYIFETHSTNLDLLKNTLKSLTKKSLRFFEDSFGKQRFAIVG